MIFKAKSQSMILAALVVCLFIVGCKRSPVDELAEIQLDGECEDPRPELCTMDYRPVCALRDTGIRCITTPCQSTEWKTYSNACSACSDPDVMGYKNGECLGEDDAT
jgi:hypothetical protein